MATGPYDLGPFQTLSAINFAQGGIFGFISVINPAGNGAFYPQTFLGFCSNLTGIPAGQTPDRTLGTATVTTLNIWVGANTYSNPNNPLNPGDPLSESPLNPSGLYTKRITHVDSGEFFDVTTGASAVADVKDCEEVTNRATWSTSTGQSYSPSGLFSPTEIFTFRGVNVGTDFEFWAMTFTYNDHFAWPSTANHARFWDKTQFDKITVTEVP